jgi:hypothetical protein
MIRMTLVSIFVCCMTLATQIEPIFQTLRERAGQSANPLLAVVGDSRHLFANQSFVMADVYFHSGYYPTIFDAQMKEDHSHLDVAERQEPHVAGETKSEPDDDDNFMGKPRDWIEKFGRNFMPTVHTHLSGDNAREIMPWLKLSADLDPHRIDTYVTASYWLRTSLNKPAEAEHFVHEGLNANPGNPDLLLELGRIYFYSKNNPRAARNFWQIALEKWQQLDKASQNPDPHTHQQILGELVRDDEKTANLKQEVTDLQELKKTSPNPIGVQQQIDQLKAKLGQK